MKIVVVDDDRQLTLLLCEFLRGRGYDSEGYHSFRDTQRACLECADVLILDINLKDGDGIDLLEELRAKYINQKYIVISGYDSLPRRLKSFALGADDYMKKPIFPSELEARIKRLFVKIPTQYRVQLKDTCLSPKEQKLLAVLIEAKGEVVSSELLSKQLQESISALYTMISRIKKKAKKTYKIKSSYARGWYAIAI